MVEPAAKAWRPVSAWAGIPAAQRNGCDPMGVRVTLCEDRGQANVLVGAGKRSAFAAAAMAAYGVTLADRPRAFPGREVTFLWSGPDHWAVIAADPHIAADLSLRLARLAAVSDQSSSRAALRVSGPKVREMLAKGVLVDLHPRAFQPGDVAVTSIAHIGASLWQVDAAPTYELSVFRSLAKSFWHWLVQSAAPFGIAIEGPPAALD
ncbi:MAG: sarcosine oxidase subunit gamma [Beijerinckiaceae bacterium]